MSLLKSCVSLAALAIASMTPSAAAAADITVTLFTDGLAGGLAGTGAGMNGDLRDAIRNSSPGDRIDFLCPAPSCTITLNGPLPPIMHDLTIDGGSYGKIVIDGSPGPYRAFFVDIGTVTLRNLIIRNVSVKGGDAGASSGAGGGFGGGAGLWVNGITAAANVTLDAVYFDGCSATGGAGGGSMVGQGGGGGLAFAGASGSHVGGGGVLSAGAGANGGDGGGGAGALGLGGNPGVGYATNTGGAARQAAFWSGRGGFGGGGGGSTNGGHGGFGGGGGAGVVNFGGAGGNGGFGGGGGASGGLGGRLGGAGSATTTGAGGGGAAGPCVFVNEGELNIVNSGYGGAIVAVGGAAGGTGSQAGTGLASPVYLARGDDAGSIAGSVTSSVSGAAVVQSAQGIVPGALRAGEPVIAPIVPAPVPTLTEWAMMLFGLLLAAGATLQLQRRRA